MKINHLYTKVDEFDTNLSASFKSSLQCKKGCSQCCYVNLSVFEVEAQNIKTWFESLSSDEKTIIKNKLKSKQIPKDDKLPKESDPCVFLKNDECIIYPARPLICRTQGNALYFVESEVKQVDICPLNEAALDNMDNQDLLNLDLLNSILVKLNYELGYDEQRISLEHLAQFMDNHP